VRMLDRGVLINSSEVLLHAHGERPKGLVDKTIVKTWSVWDTEQDEWFADEAVVLEVEGLKLELALMYLDSIVLSWNQIDLSSGPKRISDWDDSFTLRCSSNAHSNLKQVVGKTIRRNSVIEYFYGLTMVEDRKRPENVGQKLAKWILHGLKFDFDDACLLIYNDLDKTGISLEPFFDPKFRKAEVK